MKWIEIAESQLGVTEHPQGSNGGKEVDMYLKSVGLGTGFSWCAAFVYWCVKQAGISTNLCKNAGVLNMWRGTNAKYKFNTPKEGDIFIMDFGGGKGHTGFVLAVNGTSFTTIEGNSDAKGSRTGGSVCSNTRSIHNCVGFIRLLP